jgi:four helix bundle protein
MFQEPRRALVGHSYRELIAWQKAKALAIKMYRVSDTFPNSELYGLKSQTRRAAVSVASNIAEGQGRKTPGEFAQFLGNARGSLLELQTQIDIAAELGFMSPADFRELERMSGEVLALVNGLCTYTEKSQSKARCAASNT